MTELIITSPYVDSNACTMGNPMPVDLNPMLESTLCPSQGLRIWPHDLDPIPQLGFTDKQEILKNP